MLPDERGECAGEIEARICLVSVVRILLGILHRAEDKSFLGMVIFGRGSVASSQNVVESLKQGMLPFSGGEAAWTILEAMDGLETLSWVFFSFSLEGVCRILEPSPWARP